MATWIKQTDSIVISINDVFQKRAENLDCLKKLILGIRNQKSLQQAHVPSFNTQCKVKRQLFMSTKNKEKRYNTAELISEKHRISKE